MHDSSFDSGSRHSNRTAGERQAEARARDVISRLSLREKVKLMSGSSRLAALAFDFAVLNRYNRRPYPAGGLPREGVDPVLFCDGPRGVVSGNATCFPVAMGRGASWDPDLEERIGDAIGRELRAIGGNFFGGVCINLLRHPAWGRAQETYGEDPHLLGEMGAALIRGVQRHNVMACVKHYALNSIENSRFTVDVAVDERTLREVYLPHFRRCVEEGVASVMGSYNRVRGEYACENSYLLTSILRDDWGFDGFVMSDFVFGVHHTVPAALAGLDMEMPFTWRYGRRLRRAVRRGEVPAEVVDRAALRIIRTVLHFTEAEDPESYPARAVASARHTALAREAAEKSMTLIRNERGTLPFDGSAIRSLAVIGSLADADNIGDHGSSRVYPPYVVTALGGLRERLGASVEVTHVPHPDPAAVARAARAADAVVVVAGYDHCDEGEYMVRGHRTGGDRDSLRLHANEVELIRAAATVNPNCAVVLIGGSAIVVEEWKDAVGAILLAWYPGMEGGRAIADALFGGVNPGGKIPFTIPADEGELPWFTNTADAIEYGRYHGYTLCDKSGTRPAYPFGFGLSYTRFEVADVTAVATGETIEVTATIRNVGERTGDEVLQVYAGFPETAHEMPVKKLCGFRRVTIDAGGAARAAVTVRTGALRWYNDEIGEWQLEPGEYTLLVGTSSDAADLHAVSVRL